MFKNRFVLKMAVLLSVVFPLALNATWSTPVALTSNPSDLPCVTVDFSGNAVAVWQGYDGFNYRTEASTLPFGGNWTSEVWISDAGGDAQSPEVCVDKNGNAVAAWCRWSGVDSIVQASQLPFGGSWTTPVNVSGPGDNAGSCVLAMDFLGNVGNAVAVWHRFNGSNFVIQGATLPSGGSWSSPADITPSGQDALDPQVAVDCNGNTTITCARFDGTDFDVRSASQLYSQPWGPNYNLSSVGETVNLPSVNVDGSGNAMVAWSESNGTNFEIRTSLLSPGGNWSSSLMISSSGVNSYAPLVVMEPAGDAVVVWVAFDGANYVLQGSSLVSGIWSAPSTITTSGFDVGYFNLCIDLSGNATVIWDSTDGTLSTVQSAKLPFGATWTTPVVVSTSGAQAYHPDVAVDGSGNVVGVWLELNGGNYVLTAASRPFSG